MLALVALLALGAAPPDLTAVGVVMGSRPAAILRAGTRSRVVSVGDSVFGGRVIGITPAGVTLEFAGARTEISVAKGLPATPPRPPVAEIAEAAASPAQVMERREVERRLGQEMPRILSETAVVSLAETGQGTGVSITRMAEGTLLTDVGLRVG